jgi:hypothetical protein
VYAGGNNIRKCFMKNTIVFLRILAIGLISGLVLVGCDTSTNNGKNGGDEESITITITNLPENGESVLWLSSDNSGNSAFFQNLKAGGITTVSGNTGTFLLKKPTSDILGFTDENWEESGSFYLEVGFGKKNNGQWERSWGSPEKIAISNGATIAFNNNWVDHN